MSLRKYLLKQEFTTEELRQQFGFFILDPNNEIKTVGVLWWEWLFNRGTTLLLNTNNEEVQVESSYLKQTTNLMGTTILLLWV